MKNSLSGKLNELYICNFLKSSDQISEEIKKSEIDVLESDLIRIRELSKSMSDSFLEHIKRNQSEIMEVFWTAKPNSLSKIFEMEIDQKYNPIDVLVKFSDEVFLGISAKHTKNSSGDIGFKNFGLATIERIFNLGMTENYKNYVNAALETWGLPKTSKLRKNYIRANIDLQQETDYVGYQILIEMRNILLEALRNQKQDFLKEYFLTAWLNSRCEFPKYLKVTGCGLTPPFFVHIENPMDNKKVQLIKENFLEFVSVSDTSIGILCKNEKIMKIRFKFASEKLASSIKMSGEPW